MLYLPSADFTHVHMVFEESAFLVVKLLCNWICISRKLQLKILGSGLLYGSLSSVRCLLPHLQEENEVCYVLFCFFVFFCYCISLNSSCTDSLT